MAPIRRYAPFVMLQATEVHLPQVIVVVWAKGVKHRVLKGAVGKPD